MSYIGNMLKILAALTVAASAPVIVPASILAQSFPSLTFEQRSGVDPRRPFGWLITPNQYAVYLDSSRVKEGRFSLRSQHIVPAAAAAPQTAPATVQVFLPVESLRGRKLTFSAWMRSDSVDKGFAGILFNVRGPKGTLQFDNMFNRPIHGSTPWQRYVTEFVIDTAATNISVGFMHAGNGSVWFDSVSILVDDRPLELPSNMPSPAESNAMKRHVYPLKTEMAGSGFADLGPLGRIFGDARIVSLGEGTHGTAEYFRMKHRLTEYLAVDQKFTVFAIEANMPEARIVNDYVLTGRGDAKAALKGMYFWTWNTQEVLDLIEWMRAYNKSGRGRMEFWGFDMQTPNVAIDSVRAFIHRHDAAFDSTVTAAYAVVKEQADARKESRGAKVDYTAWRSAAQTVLDRFTAKRSDYLTSADSMEVAWAEQNARIVMQAVTAASGVGASRDSSMAVNVKWMLEHSAPGTKAVLWAHNAHVSRQTPWMGEHLNRMYGNAQRIVGFAMGEGSYTASGPRGITSYASGPPQRGSAESVFDGWNIERFALDLRSAAADPSIKWLREPQTIRMIGAVPTDAGYLPVQLAKAFDVLIYFRHTTPTVTLPR